VSLPGYSAKPRCSELHLARSPDTRGWHLASSKARFLSFGMVCSASDFLLWCSCLLSALLAVWTKYIGACFRFRRSCLNPLIFLFLCFLSHSFAMIFKLLPHTKIAWSESGLENTTRHSPLCDLLLEKFVIGFRSGRAVGFAYGARGFCGRRRMDLLSALLLYLARNSRGVIRAHAGFATQTERTYPIVGTFVRQSHVGQIAVAVAAFVRKRAFRVGYFQQWARGVQKSSRRKKFQTKEASTRVGLLLRYLGASCPSQNIAFRAAIVLEYQ